MHLYLLTPYDRELHTNRPMIALKSTARSIVTQAELQCANEATSPPRLNVFDRHLIANNKKASSIPQKIAPGESKCCVLILNRK